MVPFRNFLSKLFPSNEAKASMLPTPVGAAQSLAVGYYGILDATYATAFSDWLQDRSISLARLQALPATAAIECLDNRGGYIREFSLRVLMAQDWVDALRPVMRRLNDNVPINRQLALQLVLHGLAHRPVAALVDALPDFYALENQSRVDFKQIITALQARLSEPESRDLVLAGVSHTSAKVRRRCWQLCLAIFDWSNQERVERAITSGDTRLARAVEPLVLELPDAELQALLAKRQGLRAMPLRRALYLSLWRRKLGDMDALFSLALWDRSFSIRWLARHWSNDNPQVLVAAYRRMLAEPTASTRLKRYALEGLGQLAQADSLDCCEAALQDTSPALRRAALEALCSLVPATRYGYLTRALLDGDMAVVRKCFELSLKTGDYLAYDDLLPIVQTRSRELEFFVSLIAYADRVSAWLGIHLVSLTRFAQAGVHASLKPHVDAFLDRWAGLHNYSAASQKQWSDVCAWLPYETFDARSPLRFALEGEAKRVKAKG